MSDPTNPQNPEALPEAKTKSTRRKFPFIWVVPIISALIAGYLVYKRVYEHGPLLTIRFKDVSGLKPGQTPVRYRGVNIGRVTDIELSRDGSHALVKCRLKRPIASLAGEGSAFWIVRPQLGIANITGLSTIITGPHIELLPAGSKPIMEFEGLENSPIKSQHEGLNLILLSNHRGSLKPGSPIYYRGIEVGAVQDCRLSTNASSVQIDVFIEHRYTNLIRGDSKFWNVSGFDMKFSLFGGAQINMESLRSLAAGGITFATPTDPKEGPAVNGMLFRLYDEPRPEWLEWTPRMLIPEE